MVRGFLHSLLPFLLVMQSFLPNLVSAQIKSAASIKKTPPPKVDAKPIGANPNVLFEGYSKILVGGVHAGYTILRYEYDPKSKQFAATYIIKTDELGGNVLESLHAVADQNMGPISYQYTSLVGKDATTVDAKFSGAKMNALVKKGKDKKTVVTDIPKGSFIGIFLYFVILRSPKGLQTETKYDYKAIAEEDAKIYDGSVSIGKEEKFNGIRAFHGTNTFKGLSNSFYLTDTGEILMTDAPNVSIKTILVAKPQDALGSFKIPTSVINSVFGEMPLGVTNKVSKTLMAEVKKASEPQIPATKKEGIPPDPKIMIKAQPAPAPEKIENGGD